MPDKKHHHIPDPMEITHEIAEETKEITHEIAEGISRLYCPLDFNHPHSLKYMSHHLHELMEKRLWLKILLGMFLGVAVGLLLGPFGGFVEPEMAEVIGEWIALPGYIFLGLLKMIVIPLVLASIILGVASSESMADLKKTGLSTALYFIVTTAIATCIGLGMALFIRPGQYIGGELLQAAMEGEAPSVAQDMDFSLSLGDLPSKIGGLLPSNPLDAMVQGEMLQVVIIAIIVGVALVSLSRRQAVPLIHLLNSVQAICMTVVKWSMALAPVAVFGLLTKFTIMLGIDALVGMAVYVATVLASLGLLMGMNLIIISVLARKNPFDFLKAVWDVLLLAFSTSSSAAVMPVSIKTAEEKLGVRPSISQFVIPLGATVNMNGTALYQGVATVFLAEVFGIHLGFGQLVLVMVMAVAAAIGTPSIPGVGIVILAMILSSVGIPTTGIALIMGVDRILDMTRTSVNVAGDLVTCTVMDRFIGGKGGKGEGLEGAEGTACVLGDGEDPKFKRGKPEPAGAGASEEE
ncbi:Proton/glutamate symport protein / Sodium/glutamate symport protein [Methanosarcina sp. MTP4]|uniref:dicarboxylate/amino acid:cation symporter n=1 Tax=Methanosarcina sp. MTP4 TaxID=1434100 RepID=UPI00061604A0|nr:dicarboxylate/amino acid:cation symporter [Methanosarcina sp. MTP4]AKB24986.1 Proton/glutamate symport protein / Sodium/glutamate symport protein [Methanosarcina sp. MTP4]